ncbi:restriction endonuclease subunit S [Streptococcus suis]|uniref:restriction endonuclease subunit S n=1 Tax=Streptococcus suis TaxID=1307 RepID=UPI00211B8CB6|nr:restriction endonuclease subunit S [Streptococcus suis]MCQ9226460.1 restriction endonuclease subunit S [Streptococcus suis]MCQ9228759.1 restriction endonuclease subunit S [Streptococcus suis]MCQ9242765.1 restriction endonuclease subunit S [Streptococcus suis]MCQ9275023.1 restriction endonuclease subunit S [Streptococcus suis]MDE7535979.1 restriction endonuclease subunit S [Streptococcus suis]
MKTNNNIPAYRFQGYTDAWELGKAMEIFKVVSDKGYAGLPILSASQELGMIRRDEIGIDIKYDKEAVANYKRVLPGQFVIHLRSFQGGFAWSEIEGLTSPAYTILDFKEENSSKFWRNVLTSPNFIKKLETVTYGIRDGRSISYSDFSTLNFVIPSLPEQEAIGTFFSTLDRHITLHQRKLDTLKEQKKTYLKLLFPAKGQTKPALRFRGFEDDWEEVKLGELCDIRTGKLDANAMVENGEYDFYTSGIKKYRIDVAEFEGPAITIAGNGATVGYMHLADGKFNAYQRTYVLTNFKVDRSYIFSEIAKKLPIKIQQEARTGNIPYIVLSMLTELSISLPSLPEQEAIGTFFQTLDQEIAQVEDKLASLKEMKKTLLRKLFV